MSTELARYPLPHAEATLEFALLSFDKVSLAQGHKYWALSLHRTQYPVVIVNQLVNHYPANHYPALNRPENLYCCTMASVRLIMCTAYS